MLQYKGLMIILDGVGDRPIPAFGNRTPLEQSSTPNMDQLLASGQCSLVDPLLPGLPVGTHTGTSLLLGLPVAEAIRLSRGPVEAAGIGLSSQPGDLLLRCNFATLSRHSGGFDILDRRAGCIQTGTDELAAALGNLDLGNGITAILHPATQHRAVLKLTGQIFSSRITDTYSGHRYESLGLRHCEALDSTDGVAVITAEAINRFTEQAFEILDNHPVNNQRRKENKPVANGIICRSPGTVSVLPSLVSHLGLKAAVIAGEETIIGLANLLEYQTLRDDRFSSLPDTDIDAKVECALKALREYDLVFLHIKGPDICSHDLDPVGKMKLIERIDRSLSPLLDEEIVIGITGDHSTDSNSGRHTGDPLPALISSSHGRVDGVTRFGERECAQGGLGRITATAFLATLLDQMNVMHNLRSNEVRFYF
ncbi:MAG: hypothetical protein DIZ78_05480 [endosymbiont of Escarpia spicata]|uniref:Metalloenzyme domain-containing protein n=1 Tax=endosymbiont of Escarpia spicata TaxID=2200908 RepID=A0A370DQK2_9GAMM|nr:MAG: hypothetical protein DIZ78_05480 [endosymbiont of Escarpia spicata]